jgi:hypothetical protein
MVHVERQPREASYLSVSVTGPSGRGPTDISGPARGARSCCLSNGGGGGGGRSTDEAV